MLGNTETCLCSHLLYDNEHLAITSIVPSRDTFILSKGALDINKLIVWPELS